MVMDAQLGGAPGDDLMDEKFLDSPTRIETAPMEIGLSAAIICVRDDEPEVLTLKPEANGHAGTDALPYGPFSPVQHQTLEIGLRNWVEEQTELELGYVEQLYTFGDRGRQRQPDDSNPHIVSIGYLAFTRPANEEAQRNTRWRSWYDFFPWEDWRQGKPALLTEVIDPLLQQWAEKPPSPSSPAPSQSRQQRLRITFGMDGGTWDEEKVLERYELLYGAGLMEEARRDGREAASCWTQLPQLGSPMRFDHRRILATAIGRTRAKIKYRPVVFELMPPEFTLYELQKTVEAILGPHLHKQNFRRLVESAGLVEPTGDVRVKTGGRPAKLYRFRQEVLLERPAPGVRIKSTRAS